MWEEEEEAEEEEEEEHNWTNALSFTRNNDLRTQKASDADASDADNAVAVAVADADAVTAAPAVAAPPAAKSDDNCLLHTHTRARCELAQGANEASEQQCALTSRPGGRGGGPQLRSGLLDVTNIVARLLSSVVIVVCFCLNLERVCGGGGSTCLWK